MVFMEFTMDLAVNPSQRTVTQLNPIKIVLMKTTPKLQKRKLTKKELKNITGSGSDSCYDGFCRMGIDEPWQLGAGDQHGFCCQI